jgi:hypothetical protein
LGEKKRPYNAETQESFAIVTPAGCELYIADSIAASQILMRKKDFPKPLDLTSRQDVTNCPQSRDNNMAVRETWNIWEELGYCTVSLPSPFSLPLMSISLFLCASQLMSLFIQVNGADWSRHHRCTAIAFSEKIHEAV